MKRLVAIALVLALAWSAHWLWKAQSQHAAIEGWFHARQAAGWQAEYSDLSVSGFPNRLDTTFTDVSLADTQRGLAWSTDLFQVLQLVYNDSHLILYWPQPQRIATPYGAVTLGAEDLRASLIMEDVAQMQPARFLAEGLNPTLDTEGGLWSADKLRFAAEKDPASTANYHLFTRLDGLRAPFPAEVQANLPDAMTALEVDLRVAFDAPWNSGALRGARPQITALKIEKAFADWGPLHLDAAGQLTLDQRGIPEGEITVRAVNWPQMLETAVDAGKITPKAAKQMMLVLDLVAQASGKTDELDATFTFKGGMVRLGVLPLGPAPQIVIR